MTMLIRKPRIAFQGERGAFSEEAAQKLLGPEIELISRTTFEDLYTSLDKGIADYILAPVQNSIAGVVQPSVDLLRSSSLKIVDEIEIKIEQHLIGCPGASLEVIETVLSHPVALAQCRRFFEQHPRLKPVIADDTAGSIAQVIRLGDPTVAAIGGERAADLYRAAIICRNVHDETGNFTRFVLLSVSTSQIPEEQPLVLKEEYTS